MCVARSMDILCCAVGRVVRYRCRQRRWRMVDRLLEVGIGEGLQSDFRVGTEMEWNGEKRGNGSRPRPCRRNRER